MFSDTFYKALKSQVEKGYLYLDHQSQAFLVSDQKAQMAATGVAWDLYYVKDDAAPFVQLRQFVQSIAALQNTLNAEEVRRVQLIYRIGIHTLTIDFKVEKNRLSCLMLDAMNSAWVLPVKDLLSGSDLFQSVYVALPDVFGMTPQAVGGNCHFFALEQAKTLLEHDPYPVCEEKAKKQPDFASIAWRELDVRFIKDAESRAFLEYYLQKNPEAKHLQVTEELTLEHYLEQRSYQTGSDPTTYPNAPYRPFSIEMHAIQYFADLQHRIKTESKQSICDACEPRAVLTNEQWRAEKTAVAEQAHPLHLPERLSLEEALALYVPPYTPVPGF